MSLSDKDLSQIQDYFKKLPDVSLVYLYGSYAYGNPHPRSDIDIGVIFNQPQKGYSRVFQITDDLSKLNLPAKPEVHEIHLDLSPVFLQNVIRGVSVYIKDETQRIKFEVKVMNQLRDTQQLRKIRDYYLQQRVKEGTYGHRPKYTV